MINSVRRVSKDRHRAVEDQVDLVVASKPTSMLMTSSNNFSVEQVVVLVEEKDNSSRG